MARSTHIRNLTNINQLEGPQPPLVVHAEGDWFDHILSGGCDFFEKISQTAFAHNFRPLLVNTYDVLSPSVIYTDHLQIVIGPKHPQGPRIFHARPSYIQNFWYLDPQGFYWNSSVNELTFSPDRVDCAEATYFFNGVSGYFTRNNISLRPQNDRGALPPADAFIPLQNIEKYPRKIHHLTSAEIIETTCRSVSGRVYVKLHPLHNEAAKQTLRDICARFANAVLSDASVHDLIAASNMVISQNSAVGFEALMHKKPVLICAECDYHHGALTCKTSHDLRDNIQNAMGHFHAFPFEKYFYWFLGQQMLEPQKEEFTDRAWARLLSTS
ncbi:hypothetical protein [Halocynthiibacter namhaensis]|uniref:capsular polysaccharide export protein, LipB/KpsS family n=1 Tax=Halocynthiibacter namhaensis TaxID=1290553 RepID=UPI0005793115|nr:hypothetical protein [Halocynthiibacter namhaensis]